MVRQLSPLPSPSWQQTHCATLASEKRRYVDESKEALFDRLDIRLRNWGQRAECAVGQRDDRNPALCGGRNCKAQSCSEDRVEGRRATQKLEGSSRHCRAQGYARRDWRARAPPCRLTTCGTSLPSTASPLRARRLPYEYVIRSVAFFRNTCRSRHSSGPALCGESSTITGLPSLR
jgi:hypothetical protein